MTIHELIVPLDEACDFIVESLAGESDAESFNAALIAIGSSGVVIVGPHSTRDSGFCWCQPRLERVVHAGDAAGPHDDYVFVHDDRIH